MKNRITFLLISFCLLLTFSCDPKDGKSNNPDKEVSAPEGLISQEEAKQLEESYIEQKRSVLLEYYGEVDTRDFTIEIDRLEDYIAYVRQEAKKQGKEATGFRIYLGAYKRENKKFGYNTIFFVPTEKRGSQASILQPMDGSENENITSVKPLDYVGAGKPEVSYTQ